MLGSQKSFFDEVSKDSWWNSCTEVETTEAILRHTFTGLTEETTYRIKVRQQSLSNPAIYSSWTNPPIIITTNPPSSKATKHIVDIYLRGNGALNHMTSKIVIDGTTILEKGNTRGLYLVVLNR